MANDFTGNPWKIDTVFTTGFPLETNIKITHIEWEEMAAGATIVVLDKAGRTILDTTAIAANEDRDWGVHSVWLRGLQVPTLSSGRLMVFLAP